MTAALVLVANAGDGAIATYRLEGETLVQLSVIHGLRGVSAFAVDESRDLVHAGARGDAGAIVTLALDRASGALTVVGRRDVDATLEYVTLAAHGRLLLGASYHGGYGSVWPVADDGAVGGPTARIEFPNLHSVVVAGGHAYFASLGADLVAQYALGADGTLTPLDPPSVAAPAGSGPRHLVVSADGTSVYLLTEFSGEAIRFSRDTASGVLTRAEAVPAYDTSAGLGHSVFGANPVEHHYIWGADLHLTPDGRWLLCSERTESLLTTIAVAPDGRLTGPAAVSRTERQPRGFAVSADGNLVIAAGEKSTELALSRLEHDGSLTLLTRVPTGAGANWVRVVPLP